MNEPMNFYYGLDFKAKGKEKKFTIKYDYEIIRKILGYTNFEFYDFINSNSKLWEKILIYI